MGTWGRHGAYADADLQATVGRPSVRQSVSQSVSRQSASKAACCGTAEERPELCVTVGTGRHRFVCPPSV